MATCTPSELAPRGIQDAVHGLRGTRVPQGRDFLICVNFYTVPETSSEPHGIAVCSRYPCINLRFLVVPSRICSGMLYV